jgi:uncharacterized repeat protein (TIGR01451 family)
MDGPTVTAPTAPVSRRFGSTPSGGTLSYFSGAADVTEKVRLKRNADYTLASLGFRRDSPYCSGGVDAGILGGFALLVIYSDPAEQLRTLNLYEGFQYLNASYLSLPQENFHIPNPLVAGTTGRVAHIAWLGNSVGSQTDYVQIDGYRWNGYPIFGTKLSDTLNPSSDVFNSKSNVNNDASSYGIDFDAFPLTTSVMTAGASSINLYFGTATDPLLFSAAVIALPCGACNDLSITMSHPPVLTKGQNATYTMTVSNAGPTAESGPVVIKDTLPTGMSYVSHTPTSWTCTTSGQVVTCSNSASLAAGASLPALALTVLVSGTGTLTNTATVTGNSSLFDSVTANNTASDTSTVGAAASNTYVFTDAACLTGVAFGAPTQTCAQIGSSALVAGTATPVYVTVVNDSGVPSQLSATINTTVKLNFAIACINPTTNAGVAATYLGVALPLCSAGGTTPAQWSGAVDMVFNATKPSAVLNSFTYSDVGMIQLFAKDLNGKTSSGTTFVVRPASLEVTAVARTSDNLANPATTTATGNGFARAGEALTIKVAAFTSGVAPTGHKVAPNFGSEGATVRLATAAAGASDVKAAMVRTPVSGDFEDVIGGEFIGTAFSLDDVGVYALTPQLVDNTYLGVAAPMNIVGATVGRIYPDHFDTAITAAPLPCLPRMNCPANGAGAVYSGQPFNVRVQAMNAGGAVLQNYSGALARPVTLAAFGSLGGALANPGAGVLSSSLVPAASFTAGAVTGAPVYTLPNPFINSAPRARNWSTPIALYLRASASEAVAAGTLTITSLRGAASVEGGVMAISGRLSLDSPHGSELLKMPVRAEAQYWTSGGRWEPSSTDSVSTVQSGGIAFANCTKGLGPPCPSTAILGVTANSLLTLSSGTATFWLRPPGAGRNGSAEFQMNNPAWLPSSVGRAVFGVFKSPLIYQREVY